MKEFTIGKNDAGQRLVLYLFQLFLVGCIQAVRYLYFSS